MVHLAASVCIHFIERLLQGLQLLIDLLRNQDSSTGNQDSDYRKSGFFH